MMIPFQTGDALLIVDAQKDFFSDGALATPESHQIIPILNEMITTAQKKNIPIIASRDWHPADHCSFDIRGGPWPVHCVQGSEGAAFHPDVNIPESAIIVNKAFKKDVEAYSAFEGRTLDGQSLEQCLKSLGVKRVWVGGLALDFCVKESVSDGIKAGFVMNVVLDATRAIFKEKTEELINAIKQSGGRIV